MTITSCRYRVNLYSLKNNSWKKIREVPNDNVVRFDHHSGKWAPNGSIYWGACRQSKIFAFDLKKEEFIELVLPDEIRQMESRKHVIVLGGCLGVYYWPRTPKHEILAWTMKEDEKRENWSMLMTGSEYRWNPICSLDNMKLLLCKQELNSLIMFAVYDPKGIRKYPIRIRGITGCRGLGWITQRVLFHLIQSKVLLNAPFFFAVLLVVSDDIYDLSLFLVVSGNFFFFFFKQILKLHNAFHNIRRIVILVSASN